MARTSSRSLNNTEAVVSSVQENTAQENETVTKLHTAAYCRLSVENRGRKDEGTIETQVKMEKGYIDESPELLLGDPQLVVFAP